MIVNRPTHLTRQTDYNLFPDQPFSMSMDSLPPLVRESLGSLGGIQPITGAMACAASGMLSDKPSDGEVAMFRAAGTQFQMVMLVANIAHLRAGDGVPVAHPYALTLMPATKRGAISTTSIDFIVNMAGGVAEQAGWCYTGLDPFTGESGLFGVLGDLIGRYSGTLDEVGVVLGQYYLQVGYDTDDALETPLGFDNPRQEEKYRRHRTKLLYRPFYEAVPRRVWGAESPIELFLMQELLRRGLDPQPQVLFTDDGGCHSSLYHLWKDVEFRHAPGIVTEADFFFPGPKLAVFCDSGSFHRGPKAQAKDEAIDTRLQNLGVTSVRVSGRTIVRDLAAAADAVCARL
jgi:hypothetical protein